MRKRYRLHLLDLLDLRSSPTVLPSLLSTPVETMASPSKAHYHTLRYYYRLRSFSSVAGNSIMCFWWRWGESNPRPEVLRFEGITAILYIIPDYLLKVNIKNKNVSWDIRHMNAYSMPHLWSMYNQLTFNWL